jgi:YD repeat-containing protein
MKTTLNITLMLMLAGLCITPGCKKTTNTSPGGGGSTGLLKTMIQVVSTPNGTDSTITNLAYDSQNRVVSQVATTKINSTLFGIDTTTYTFGTGSVMQYSSTTGVTVTYTLNSLGFRSSDNLGDTWTYNTAGYMTQSTQAAAGSTTTYTYNSSNQLTMETAVSNSGTNTYTFTYATNPIGKAGSSWSQGQSTGDQFATDVEVQNGTTTTLTATYTLNAQGQLGETSIVSSGSASPVVTYFIYY